MRQLLSLAFVVFLGVAVAACGGASKRTRSAQYTPSAKLGGVTPAAAAVARRRELARVNWVRALRQPHLKNDGDHDEPGDEDHDNNRDTGTGPGSIDPFVDYLPPANNTAYHDEDDMNAIEVGHPAGPADTRAIAALVKRYYAAAVAADGERACSMMQSAFAKAVPIDYGQFGASYLRGGRTCAVVTTRLFDHLHGQLTADIQVTEVRIRDSQAWAFFGSKRTPPGLIILGRQGASWRIMSMLGTTLP